MSEVLHPGTASPLRGQVTPTGVPSTAKMSHPLSSTIMVLGKSLTEITLLFEI